MSAASLIGRDGKKAGRRGGEGGGWGGMLRERETEMENKTDSQRLCERSKVDS